MIPTALAPSIPDNFIEELKLIDHNLKAVFNCQSERFEIYRYSKGRWHWVLIVENDDETFRPLDNRTLKKLKEMDIIARYGSIANYEIHMDNKKKKWLESQDKEMNHELHYDIKDNRKLWQRAVEEIRSGKINPPPEEKDKKIISYPKGVT